MYVALDCELPPRPGSVREARHAVEAAVVHLCSHDALHGLLVIVSELATNAVEHARSEFRVRVVVEDERHSTIVRIEVGDADPRRPVLRQRDGTEEAGGGLALVQALSARWGIEHAASGKIVYAEVPC